MKVFKYLVALADISVGFLGLFFIIFAITRPTVLDALSELQRRDNIIRELRSQIRELQELNLAKAESGKALPDKPAANIRIEQRGFRVDVAGHKRRFTDAGAFQKQAGQIAWPKSIVLYVDRRVPFARVVQVIDILKQVNHSIRVKIAALAK